MEPEATGWTFPPADTADDDGIVGIGADLRPGTVLDAYRQGLFPMPLRAGVQQVLAWWSPDPRGILPLDGLHVSRSLRRSCDRYEVTFDGAFEAGIGPCPCPRSSRSCHETELLTSSSSADQEVRRAPRYEASHPHRWAAHEPMAARRSPLG